MPEPRSPKFTLDEEEEEEEEAEEAAESPQPAAAAPGKGATLPAGGAAGDAAPNGEGDEAVQAVKRLIEVLVSASTRRCCLMLACPHAHLGHQ